MRATAFCVLVAICSSTAAVLPVPSRTKRSLLGNTTASDAYTIPRDDADPTARTAAIQVTRDTFLYGAPPNGNASYYPSGVLGKAVALADVAAVEPGAEIIELITDVDETEAKLAVELAGGLKDLSDYELLYDGQWSESAPITPDPGMLTNYTQDLLFSMERLSTQPYIVRRLNPSQDQLPFAVDDTIVSNLTGVTLDSLLQDGRLFYANHSGLAQFPTNERYSAACEAYFYMDPQSDDFLPLAIRPDPSSDLIYTPLDSANDWLLAKIFFEQNDVFYAATFHYAVTHFVAEIIYEAAIRTLSASHPVLAILQRLSFNIFAIRPLGALALFNTGGAFDQFFPFSGATTIEFFDDIYYGTAPGYTTAGAFRSNYFYTDLMARGLYECSYGPALKNFPFLDDAQVIYSEIQKFMTAFVASYYPDDATLADDQEIQNWMDEAVPANIIDFESAPLASNTTLVDILTQFAWLVSGFHHTLNTDVLFTAQSVLPLHPFALYQPIPTAKGVTDIIPFLPDLAQSAGQIAVAQNFDRPNLINSSSSLVNMFNDATMLARMNEATNTAASAFYDAMQAQSEVVSARDFDAQGLSQGMPFVWKILDPQIAPFSLTI